LPGTNFSGLTGLELTDGKTTCLEDRNVNEISRSINNDLRGLSDRISPGSGIDGVPE
jgi:hypothetical protein